MEDIYDITVVGGGPVGLYGLYYAGLRDMKAKVVEALPQLGGQPAALYPEKYIYDVAGYPKVLAQDLVASLEEQAKQYDPAICTGERVLDLTRRDDGVLTLTTNRAQHLSRTVLIAAGIGAFAPRRLEAPGLDRLEGRGVYYFVRDREALRGKKVMIVGGGDSAIDWAASLADVAASVMLVHRRAEFRAHERAVEDLTASPRVTVLTCQEIVEVAGKTRLEGVTLLDNRTGETSAYRIDALLLSLGFLADLGPLRDWGLALNRNVVPVNAHMQTNIPGVYAAGDIAVHPGHLKLISVGAAEAAIAVNHARHFIDPRASVEPGHSSSRMETPSAL